MLRRPLFGLTLLLCAYVHGQVCTAPTQFPILSDATTFESMDHQSVDYEDVVDAWLVPASPLRMISCPNGVDQCLVVPVLGNSSNCSVDYGRCGATAGSETERCVATDEMSQFGIALAMARGSAYAEWFKKWFNTFSAMRPLGKYTLPPYVVRVVWTSVPTTMTTISANDPDINDAIDGTARIALALFIAANNPTFAEADRVRYARAAREIAAQMLEHDFIHRELTVRGHTVNQWLAAGWRVAETNGNVYCGAPIKNECGTVGFAGYYGDVMIALLAAYANTGDTSFRDAVADTLQNYLYAIEFDGVNFRVPPTEFAWWDTPPAGGDFEAHCKDTCGISACSSTDEGQWESFDAPRAVSLCKSAYYWSRLGTIDPDLDSYCEAWMATPNAITATTYRKVYSWDGNACDVPDEHFYDNGFGSYLNFYCNTAHLDDRLTSIFGTYDAGNRRFQNTSCMGIYKQTLPVISFGSAIGRDLDALTLRPTGVVAAAGASTVQLTWAALTGIDHYEIWRRNGAGTWQLRTTSVPNAFTDSIVTPGTAYLYRVRGIEPDDDPSPYSDIELATVFAFADDPALAQSTTIRASHILQLRQAVDAVRSTAGLPNATYTRMTLTPGSTPIAAIDVLELRDRLAAALTTLGFAAPAYSQSSLTPSMTIVGAVDVNELRAAVR